jgi:uncharacterized membrane protein
MSTHASRHATAPQTTPKWLSSALWILASISVMCHLAAIIFHLPKAVGGAMLAGSLMLFGLLHGASIYGWRGILCFVALCLGVSNIMENLSILTGFPFGWYHYSNLMGPKLFLVPLLIGPAYFGVGYLSWTLARIILGDMDGQLRGKLTLAVPLIASFVMVSWDLTIDPIMSTVTSNWVWHDGGSYFGVPLSNFLGWYFTVYVFFQAFALYARRFDGASVSGGGTQNQPLLAYASIVFAPLLSLVLGAPMSAVTDPAGQVWQSHDINTVTALVGLFTALPLWLLAIFRRSPGNP